MDGKNLLPPLSTLKMELASSSETLMYVHQRIRIEPFKTVIVTAARLKIQLLLLNDTNMNINYR